MTLLTYLWLTMISFVLFGSMLIILNNCLADGKPIKIINLVYFIVSIICIIPYVNIIIMGGIAVILLPRFFIDCNVTLKDCTFKRLIIRFGKFLMR